MTLAKAQGSCHTKEELNNYNLVFSTNKNNETRLLKSKMLSRVCYYSSIIFFPILTNLSALHFQLGGFDILKWRREKNDTNEKIRSKDLSIYIF